MIRMRLDHRTRNVAISAGILFFGKYERKLQNCLVAVTLLNQQGKDFLSLAGEYRVASHRECWQSAPLCDPVICTGWLGSLTCSHAATSEARPFMSDNNPCNPRIIDLVRCLRGLACVHNLPLLTHADRHPYTHALTRARARTQRLVFCRPHSRHISSGT